MSMQTHFNEKSMASFSWKLVQKKAFKTLGFWSKEHFQQEGSWTEGLLTTEQGSQS